MPKVLSWEERMKRAEEKQRAKDEREVNRFLKAYERKKTYPQRMQEKAERKKGNTKTYQICLSKSTGLVSAMETMTERTGIRPATYLRKALIEKLQRDGYITETPEE